MKQALCVPSFDQLTQLIKKEIPTVEATLVDREVCEQEDSGLQQLIPYVTFYAVDADAGKLKFIQYQRPDQGEGEERLAGKTSVGFGGHIDQESEIVSAETIVKEDGTKAYPMTLSDLSQTAFNCALREIKEELNLDLTDDLGLRLEDAETAFFIGDQSEEVNRVHTGFSMQFELSNEVFEKLRTTCVFSPDEIQKLDILGLRLDAIVEDMDITMTMRSILDNLTGNHGLEDWSAKIVNYVTRKVINQILSPVSYFDMVSVAKVRANALIAEQTRKAEAEAAQAQQDAAQLQSQDA